MYLYSREMVSLFHGGTIVKHIMVIHRNGLRISFIIDHVNIFNKKFISHWVGTGFRKHITEERAGGI